MGIKASHGLAAFAGVAVGVTVTLAVIVPRSSPERDVVTVDSHGVGTGSETDAAALAAMSGEVQSLRAAVAAIDEKLDRALAGRDRTGGTNTAGDAGVAIDPEMLQRAIERAQTNAERDKFLAMTPGEVLESAEELTNARTDLGKARKMLEDLLARPLSAEDRQKALLQLGIAHRNAGDLKSSKASLQQAIDAAGGTQNESGAWAAFQMAWACQYENDSQIARRWFEQVGNSSGSSTGLRIEGRWNAAKLAEEAGDPNARAEFEAILREYGDNPAFKHIIADVKARLGM